MVDKVASYNIYKSNWLGFRKNLIKDGFTTRAEAEDYATGNLSSGYYVITGINLRGKVIYLLTTQYKITEEGSLLVFSGHTFYPPKVSKEMNWPPYKYEDGNEQ